MPGAVPFQLYLVERARGVAAIITSKRSDFSRIMIGCGFRVAHAAVEFERLHGALRVDHQSGVEEAGIGDAVLFHAP